MRYLLLISLFAIFALSTYGQNTQTFRGYLCENIDTRQTFDGANPVGQIGLTLGNDTKWFLIRVFGTPPQLTRSLNKANPRTDKIGTEYLVTYITDERGSLMAKTVKKTGRFKKVPTCLLGDPADQATPTWEKIENDIFSFSVPKTFNKSDAHGIDSFVEEYIDSNIVLDFDYGRYSNNFGDWPRDTKFEWIKIDGKAARLGTALTEFRQGFPFSSQVYIKVDKDTALSMFAAGKTVKDAALAKQIFETIAFSRKKPKP